jgi:hypothetical protein
MAHKIYRSISEMIRPEVLSSLVQQPVTRTCLKPFETAGFSSTESKFLTVDDCRIERPCYIIKRLRKEQDWVMLATEDHHWRTISIWQQGLLDRLPEGINHGIIACSKDEGDMLS